MKRVVMAVMMLAGSAAALLAQPGAVPPAQDGFVPVDQLPAAEQIPAAPLVIAAYAFIWIAMLAYVFLLWRRLGVVDRELTALRRAVEGRR